MDGVVRRRRRSERRSTEVPIPTLIVDGSKAAGGGGGGGGSLPPSTPPLLQPAPQRAADPADPAAVRSSLIRLLRDDLGIAVKVTVDASSGDAALVVGGDALEKWVAGRRAKGER